MEILFIGVGSEKKYRRLRVFDIFDIFDAYDKLDVFWNGIVMDIIATSRQGAKIKMRGPKRVCARLGAKAMAPVALWGS